MPEKKKRGRIPYEYYGLEAANHMVNVRITEVELAQLEAVAKELNCTKSRALRMLIQESNNILKNR